MTASLKKNRVFARHKLATDAGLGAMHLVWCRNIMIYSHGALKECCVALFDDALPPGGFLCLGMQESLGGSRSRRYEERSPHLSIYRKRYA